MGKPAVRIDLDDELQPAVPARRVCHGKRPGLGSTRNGEVQVLPGEKLDLRWLNQSDHQMAHVMSYRLVGDDLRDCLLDRQPGPNDVLVVVQQLDRQVLIGVCPAQQGVPLLLFEVG
jgi:hypothetical protein